MAEGSTLAVARAFIAALSRRDGAALESLIAENAVLEVPFPLVPGENATGARRSEGEAVRAYLRDMAARTTSIRFANVVWRTTDDDLAVFHGDGEIVLSDGQLYANHYLMLFRVSESRIAHWWEYLNPVAGIRAFGAGVESLP